MYGDVAELAGVDTDTYTYSFTNHTYVYLHPAEVSCTERRATVPNILLVFTENNLLAMCTKLPKMRTRKK